MNQIIHYVVPLNRDDTTQRLDKIFKIHVVVEPEGRRLTLSLPGRATIQELKTNVYYITNTPVRHQEWSGWPSGCDNDTTLAVSLKPQLFIKKISLIQCPSQQSGIELSHDFVLRIADRSQNNSNLLNST